MKQGGQGANTTGEEPNRRRTCSYGIKLCMHRSLRVAGYPCLCRSESLPLLLAPSSFPSWHLPRSGTRKHMHTRKYSRTMPPITGSEVVERMMEPYGCRDVRQDADEGRAFVGRQNASERICHELLHYMVASANPSDSGDNCSNELTN